MKAKTGLILILMFIGFALRGICEDTASKTSPQEAVAWENLLDDIYRPVFPDGFYDGRIMEAVSGIGPSDEQQKKHKQAVTAVRQDSAAPQRLLDIIQKADASDWRTSDRAIRGFSALGSLGKPVIPQLTRMLDDKPKSLQAVRALSLIGGDAFDSLVIATTNQDVLVRVTAVEALGNSHLEKAMPILIRCLDEPNIFVRCEAAEALWRNGSERDAVVAALTAHLSSSDPQMRVAATQALGFCGEAAACAIPQLQLELDDASVRDKAAWTLGLVGPKAIPALISGLTNASDNVRIESAQNLGQFGIKSQMAAPLLADSLLRDKSADVRSHAAIALFQIQGSPEIVVPALVKAMEDKDARVRWAAVDAIAWCYGFQSATKDAYLKESWRAIPSLRRALLDRTLMSRSILALEEMGEKVDVSELNK